MILGEFSKYIQSRNNDITSNKATGTKILCDWIELVDKIVHKEIMLAKNKSNDFFIVGKSESGRVLVNALYNYALSYEHYIMSKWLENKKANDFKK